ncbi:MAG: CheA signal transduction histidine kinase [Enterovirga sp.]|nr:CheA signal transduction histidine kinase [Enterovirga sp.]
MAAVNDLIEPFLAEARELIEAATDDLIALEKDPADASRIESVFRSFHTLKGSAGLLDLGPMAFALHAAEDLLSVIRSGGLAFSGLIVDACLGALDRVAAWVSAIETAGALPDEAARQATELAEELRAFIPGSAVASHEAGPGEAPAWAREIASRAPRLAAGAGGDGGVLTAIRYAPNADCFLNGDDPLAALARVPNLAAVELATRAPWPAPERLDPFSCNLVMLAVSASPRDEVAPLFRLVADQVELVEVAAVPPAGDGETVIGSLARSIIAEQQTLLREDHPAAVRAGVERAALLSVANALRHEGLVAGSDTLREAAEAGVADGLGLIASVLEPPAAAPQPEPAASPAGTGSRHVRVDAERLDSLANLASELTVARNALAHLVAQAEVGAEDGAFLQRLRDSEAAIGRLAGELHRSVMGIRLVPLSGVFRRFGRPVREIAAQLGKDIAFEVAGEETEADRAIADSLFELLLHVLRNAMDHGLERPEDRAAAGKPARGRVELAARTERDRIIITVSDDGRGIDPAAIKRTALQRRLITPEAAQTLGDPEALDLIFAPGFSTAAAVNDLSGRGVGMDAVRVGAQRLGGRVEVDSRVGRGTTIRISLPQTMMLTSLVSVRAGAETWGIPVDAVVELQRVERRRITKLKSRRAVTWRDRTIPVLSLTERLGAGPEREAGREVDMLVVTVAGEAVGLVVDGVAGRLEALVRPLGGVFSGLPGLAGTTVLGDGRILLVLDLEEVLQ